MNSSASGALVAFSLEREGTVRPEIPEGGPEGPEHMPYIPEKDEFYRDSLQFFLFDMDGLTAAVLLGLGLNRWFLPTVYVLDSERIVAG